MVGQRRASPGIFFLTRFSIRPDSELREFVSPSQAPVYLDAGWLAARLDFMKRYTIPSVEAQTDRDFRWLIGLDRSTPEPVVADLRAAIRGKGELCWTDAGLDFNDAVRLVLKTMDPAVSIRLDSDDVIERTFVAQVRKAKIGRGGVLNFPHGIALYEATGLLIHKWIPSNPFIAYHGPDSGSHVLELGIHSAVRHSFRVRNIRTYRPMWLKLYSSLATSKVPPNGFPVFGLTRRALRELSPNVRVALAEPSVPEKLASLRGFVGRTAAKRLFFLDSLYRFVSNGSRGAIRHRS